MKANEPVAWMDYLEHSDVYDLNVSGRGIPLYTHPVKEQRMIDVLMELAKYRLLSKDEIAELAILRKAQEK